MSQATRIPNRVAAAKQFAEACDMAYRNGAMLAAHGNTTYCLAIPSGQLHTYYTDRDEIGLLDWVSSLLTKAKVSA